MRLFLLKKAALFSVPATRLVTNSGVASGAGPKRQPRTVATTSACDFELESSSTRPWLVKMTSKAGGSKEGGTVARSRGHANSAKILRTVRLVTSVAFFPASRTGSPEMGSFTIRGPERRGSLGIRTMRSPSSFTSSRSPGSRRRRRRKELGSMTCPLVESRVSIVIRSCHVGRWAEATSFCITGNPPGPSPLENCWQAHRVKRKHRKWPLKTE